MPDPARVVLPTALAIVLAACPADRPAAEPALEEAPPAQAATPQAVAPEPTDQAVWAHLREADYRTWPLWPGTTERYTGTEPHGMQLTTYVNDVALRALRQGTVPLPDGSIIVKENYMPDGSYDAATVMYKRQGFDPENNDWFWAKYDGQGVAEAAGRVQMCSGCHAAQQQRDYLMTALP
jgi:hypothetical protein